MVTIEDAKRCTAHHFACDCREFGLTEKVNHLERLLAQANESIAHGHRKRANLAEDLDYERHINEKLRKDLAELKSALERVLKLADKAIEDERKARRDASDWERMRDTITHALYAENPGE